MNVDKKCCNCNKLYYKSNKFCNWSCEVEFLLRLEQHAYFQGQLKYTEFITEMKQRQQKRSPLNIDYAGVYPAALRPSLM
jgi:hypothetical protein